MDTWSLVIKLIDNITTIFNIFYTIGKRNYHNIYNFQKFSSINIRGGVNRRTPEEEKILNMTAGI